MRAGDLREVIIIEEELIARDKFGAQVKTWAPYLTLRARIDFLSDTRKVENMEVIHTNVFKISTYYRDGITRKMRISYGKDKYRILSMNSNRRFNTTELICEVINE